MGGLTDGLADANVDESVAEKMSVKRTGEFPQTCLHLSGLQLCVSGSLTELRCRTDDVKHPETQLT